MLDEAKSALPPIRPGNVLARAFRHVWERLRVASAGLSGVKLCNHPPQISSETLMKQILPLKRTHTAIAIRGRLSHDAG
jgi:hypothetical protein